MIAKFLIISLALIVAYVIGRRHGAASVEQPDDDEQGWGA